MDMVGIGSAAVCIGVAKLASDRLVKDSENRRLLHRTVWLVTFLATFLLAMFYVNPLIRPTLAASRLDDSLAERPAIAALKAHYPEAYAELVEDFKARIRADIGASVDDVLAIDQAEANALMYTNSRMPSASDDAAFAYAGQAMKVLQSLSPYGECKHFERNPSQDVLAITTRVDHNDWQSLQAAAARVLVTAAQSPMPAPTREAVLSYLRPIYQGLLSRHAGYDDLMTKPELSESERFKYCKATVDLYAQILRLPPEQGGRVYRFLFL